MARLLVCVDLSERTEAVVARAEWLAKGLGAELWILHVAAPEPEFVGYGPGPAAVRTQEATRLKDEHRATEAIGKRLQDAGIRATALVVQGPTTERILEHAERLAVDMILVASKGHGALHDAVVGSVGRDLVRRSACPVLIVPPTH
jgi:nucleotide-binding universal stress UspA family protein